jgi:hypothetical protein
MTQTKNKWPPEKPKCSRISIPEHAHPFARFVFSEMKRQSCTYDFLEWKSGILRQTFKGWRRQNTPGLSTLEAALGVLGWYLLPVPRGEQLPPALGAELKELAERWGQEDLTPHLVKACIDLPPLDYKRSPHWRGWHAQPEAEDRQEMQAA